MDRLETLLGDKGSSMIRGTHSREASREQRVNFNEHPNRERDFGSIRGRGNSYSNASGIIRLRNPTKTREGSIGSRPISNKLPRRDASKGGKHDSTKWDHPTQGRAQPSDSDRREIPEPQPMEYNDQTGYSRDVMAMNTAFDSLNRSLEIFFTRLSSTSGRSEKSRGLFKKPKWYKHESDGCIDTWIEFVKLHFEEQDLTEKQECSAPTSNLEGTALSCVMAKSSTSGTQPRNFSKFC